MTLQYKHSLNVLLLCLILCGVGGVTHAKPRGEFIYRPAVERFEAEIWIGKTQNARSTRRLFTHPLFMTQLAIQKGDRYILVVAESDFIDVYLLDRQNPKAKAKNLTHWIFGDSSDADFSINGDIVFTHDSNRFVPGGLYLIPEHERANRTPKPERLVQVDAGSVDWSPSGRTIAYCTSDGIFGYDLATQKTVKYTHNGCVPVFSPNGRYIAYIHRGDPKEKKIGRNSEKIGLFSLPHGRTIETIELKNDFGIHDLTYLTWSADGQYIVYTIAVAGTFLYRNFAVSLDGFHTTRILKNYENGVPILEWTNQTYNQTYLVHPQKKLATLWGALKAPEHTYR